MEKDLSRVENGIRLDITRWPIVIISPTPDVSDKSIEEFINTYFELIESKKERYAAVMDLTQRTNMTKNQRKILIDGMNKRKEFTAEYSAGTAVVFKSAIVRGIMMSIFWLFDPKYPTEIFKTVEEAVTWCGTQLDA